MTKLAFLSLALAACTRDLAAFDRIDEVQTGRDLDILYVFDTSADRANYGTMAGQLDVLSTQLATIDGQVPNLRVGVTTADLGTKGVDDELPGPTFRNCAGTGDGGKLTIFDAGVADPFLEDLRGENGTRVRNFAGDAPEDLGAVLGQLTNPPSVKTGCEVIQPFEAMRRALDPANNPGFLRGDDAQLMVVFLTSDDDCSLKTGSLIGANKANGAACASAGVICEDGAPGEPGTHNNCRPRLATDEVVPITEYVTFLTDLKGKENVVVSAVAGPNDPYVTINPAQPIILDTCTGVGGGHKPAPRINFLVSMFGGAAINGCTQETVYEQITQPILDRSRSCFPDLTAEDGEDCRVIETADGVDTELEPCSAGGEAACFQTFVDADACPGGANVGISIDRRSSTVPARSKIEATCFVK